MLQECDHIRQIEEETPRRWFSDEYFDLIVWHNDADEISAFQLCYDLARRPRAIHWRREAGFAHYRVDDGENRPGKIKSTPILMKDGVFDAPDVAERFRKESGGIEPGIAQFVYETLLTYPQAL